MMTDGYKYEIGSPAPEPAPERPPRSAWQWVRTHPKTSWAVGIILTLALIGGLSGDDKGPETAAHKNTAAQSTKRNAASTPAATPKRPVVSDRDKAQAVWRAFVKRTARSDASTLGGTVVKIDISNVDAPEDRGQGYLTTAGTAYIEIEVNGERSGSILDAEINNAGEWHVKRSSVNQRSPDDL